MKLTPSPDGDGKGKHVWVVGNLELCTHSPMHSGVLEALLLLQTVSHAEPRAGNLWVWVRMVPVWAFCKRETTARVGSCMEKDFISL